MSAGGVTDPWPYWRIMKSTAGSGIDAGGGGSVAKRSEWEFKSGLLNKLIPICDYLPPAVIK